MKNSNYILDVDGYPIKSTFKTSRLERNLTAFATGLLFPFILLVLAILW